MGQRKAVAVCAAFCGIFTWAVWASHKVVWLNELVDPLAAQAEAQWQSGLAELSSGWEARKTAALGRIADWVDKFNIYERNERLSRELAAVRAENDRRAVLVEENERLRALLGYKQENKKHRLVAAQVVVDQLGNMQDMFFIDAGQSLGVRRFMAVVTEKGLVGLVDEVFEDYARVLLLNSPLCRVGARVAGYGSQATGVVHGSGRDGQLVFEHLDSRVGAKAGDMVFTSGLTGRHPANIVIGRTVLAQDDDLFVAKKLIVAPAVDFNKLEQVLVVTDFELQPEAGRSGEQS